MTAPPAEPLLTVRGLVKTYPVRGGGILPRTVGHAQAVAGVDLDIAVGETLGLVGESGCGKSTVARAVTQLVRPTAGSVRFDGRELTTLRPAELRAVRRELQVVFQDPYASLDPRWRVGDIVAEPLLVRGETVATSTVDELLRLVGLAPEHRDRYPYEFSGGQRQRIGIARALAAGPKLIVLDEPVSALDVSVQAGVVNLLADLQRRLGVAYLFIAHDLAVVRHLSHRIAVMYLGRIVETGPREELCRRPVHPYTQALLSAVPLPNPRLERARRRIVLRGEAPSLLDPPSGCRFRTRCWKARDICAAQEPPLRRHGGTLAACHFPAEVPIHTGV